MDKAMSDTITFDNPSYAGWLARQAEKDAEIECLRAEVAAQRLIIEKFGDPVLIYDGSRFVPLVDCDFVAGDLFYHPAYPKHQE